VENVLAATAAGWAARIPFDVIRRGLTTFQGDARRAPGRFNLLAHGGATVIADYGHNPDALLALVEALGAVPHQRRLAVFSCAGDRRDVDILRQAEIVAASFDEVVLYEDACNRGRPDGEVTALMRRGMAGAIRASAVREVRGETRAIETALAQLRTGDVLLVLVDQIEPSLRFIEETLAKLPPPAPMPGRAAVSAPAARLAS
jgi:cyanophycin synthetase